MVYLPLAGLFLLIEDLTILQVTGLKTSIWDGENKELCNISQYLGFRPSIALWIYYPLVSGYLYSGHLEP